MPFSNKKSYPKVTSSFFEQGKDLGRPSGTAPKKDLISQIADEALAQIFGVPKTGELKEGQVLELSREKKETIPPFLEVKKEEEILFVREEEVVQEVERVREELKRAAKELKNLGQDVAEVEKAVERMPTKPGVYHLTFFDRLRQIIRFFRERIEESRTWLRMMISRKRQRRYWSLYKKHGTQFSLSSERVVATQTG